MKPGEQLVSTIADRCRACYTCVRDCPAKAIRISGGQAEVVAERCIGCGNCVQVCSQKAKQVYCSIPEVRELLAGSRRTAAIVAPSFPAEFLDLRRLQDKRVSLEPHCQLIHFAIGYAQSNPLSIDLKILFLPSRIISETRRGKTHQELASLFSRT